MRKRVVHLGGPDVTRCGMFTEILDTQVTSGTREHVQAVQALYRYDGRVKL